jgi:hypothetical protein
LKLIDDWQRIAPKLWTVRLALSGALLAAIAAGVGIYEDGKAWPVSMLVFGVNLAAAVARVIAQPGLFEGENDRRHATDAE